MTHLRFLTRMGKSSRSLLMVMVLLASLASFEVSAADTPAPATPAGGCTQQAYYDKLGRSQNSGSYDGCNSLDCCGKYQFCTSTRNTYLARNGITQDEFMNGSDSSGQRWQETIIRQFTEDNQRTLSRLGTTSSVGSSISFGNGQSVNITNSGLLGGAHLGGAGGVNRFVTSGGTYNPMDGPMKNDPRCREMVNNGASVAERNSGGMRCGTAISDYIAKFNGFDTAAGEGGGNCTPGGGNANNRAGPICDPKIGAEVTNQVQAALARKTDFIRTYMTPPAMISQVANTPCVSNELGRISNQMGTMLRGGVTGVGSAVGLGSSGPVGTLLNQAFKQDFQAFNSAASMIPRMLDFQGLASQAMGSVLQSLGLGGSLFASQMCGMMLDMVLKYIQCENPIQFPNLNNMFGSLNLKLPSSCAGKAASEGLMGLARSGIAKSFSQGVSRGASGTFSATPLQ